MLLRIDFTSQEPIYLQIRSQIVHAVASGELQAGDPLPSVRSLAGDLGVNMHTVNKAYAVLRDEGYVIMRGRSGAFIGDRSSVLTPERAASDRQRLSQALHSLALEHKAQGGTFESFISAAKEQAAQVFTTTRDSL
ncbi:MAG: GntR family transcriptional regulator [Atopobiaceae bacterium]|nr:GntR family transcriptional regulator [Atopobiaceae bacterium]MBR1829991.1 GntR family transcriptional regulator [Atopobiaceae bacterium]